jgi:hypothetical protein
VYLAGVGLSACSWNFSSFALFLLLTGLGIGAVLGTFILLLRRFVPESPRWLVTHGQEDAAEAAMAEIERRVGGELPAATGTLRINPRKSYGLGLIARVMLGKYRARVGLVTMLMAAQAFLYNALFLTYALVLTRFYHVAPARAGIFLLPSRWAISSAPCCWAGCSTRSAAAE